MTSVFRPPAHPVLDKAYANTAGAVAYLDETFHHGEDGAARFYVLPRRRPAPAGCRDHHAWQNKNPPARPAPEPPHIIDPVAG